MIFKIRYIINIQNLKIDILKQFNYNIAKIIFLMKNRKYIKLYCSYLCTSEKTFIKIYNGFIKLKTKS